MASCSAYIKLQFLTRRPSAHPFAKHLCGLGAVQAARCRRLASGILDTEVARRLLELAVEFDDRAVAEEARSPLLS